MTISADYERLIIPCHLCGKSTIVNRREDLGHTGFAIGSEITCSTVGCGAMIRISFESADADYQQMVMEAISLRKEKRYMLAIAALEQAFEMFFAEAVEIMLVWHVRNFGSATEDECEELARLLFEKTERFTYAKMRNLLISLATRPRPATSFEACAMVADLDSFARDPSDERIRQLELPLAELLLKVKALPLGTLRNRVIHKRAYRPTKSELDECILPALSIMNGLWLKLGLTESFRGPKRA